MKRTIIRLVAIVTVLVTLCVGLFPCYAASQEPCDVYREYLMSLDEPYDLYEYEDESGHKVQVVAGVTSTEAGASVLVWETLTVVLDSNDSSTGMGYMLNVVWDGENESYTYMYYNFLMDTATSAPKSVLAQGYGTVKPEELNSGATMTFTNYQGQDGQDQASDQEMATKVAKLWVTGLSELVKKADLTAADFGFGGNSEDLGGAFSGARWKYAGKMTLLGMGMVFLVLAILWGVLVIFEKCLYRPAKKEKPVKAAPAPAPSAPAATPAPAAPAATDDGVLLAVITAAVAAAMEEEGTPSNGFRVVSFKKTTGRGGPWNG